MKKETYLFEKIYFGARLFMVGLVALALTITPSEIKYWGMLAVLLFFPYVTAQSRALGITPEQQKERDDLLKDIKTQTEKALSEIKDGTFTKTEIDNKLKEINEVIAKAALAPDQLKKLTESIDKLNTEKGELENGLKTANEALKVQGSELKKLQDGGIEKDKEKRKGLFEMMKDAFVEKQAIFLQEKNDDNGKRLSLKGWFTEKGNSTTGVMKLDMKAAVNMYESLIAGPNVPLLRLTELDPIRVSIPLAIYPHVLDVFMVKNIARPNMSLMVAYEWFDGVATKPEGDPYAQSSVKFKTVEFPSFVVGTMFQISDETLDDLDEALQEISIVAPDKVNDALDHKVLGAAGDDVTDIAGILTANKHFNFDASVYADSIEAANLVDVIEMSVDAVETNRYIPNAIYMNPRALKILAAAKNTLDDSRNDRRVAFGAQGQVVGVSGLTILRSPEIAVKAFITFDNRQPWIGKRKEMTMEIGLNGTDFRQGQKSVRIGIRCAFGVRDKMGICYVADWEVAAAVINKDS